MIIDVQKFSRQEMKMMKGCPLCGSKHLIILVDGNFFNADGSYGHYIMCESCGCSTGTKTREKAIESWNQRCAE